jgi:excinuclease ABC subunit A
LPESDKLFATSADREVKKDSPESAADEILSRFARRREVLRAFSRASAEIIKIPKSKTKDQNPIPHLMSLMQQGFTRFLRDGETIELQKPEDYQFKDFQNTFVLIDRLKADKEIRQRLVDSLETCFREEGSAIIQTAGENPQTLNFSEKFICKYDGTVYEEPEPRLFSFNSPFGACPLCQGFGNTVDVDYALVVPNENLSLGKRRGRAVYASAIRLGAKGIDAFRPQRRSIPTKAPFADLTDFQKKMIFEGAPGWRGVRGFFKFLETKKYKLHVRVFMAKYRGYTTCPECGGGRLRQAARDVKVGGSNLPEIVALSIKDATVFFEELKLDEERENIAEKLLLGNSPTLEISRRCRTRLFNFGASRLDFIGRRSAAHSTGDESRLAARRRALRFGRTFNRAASARQHAARQNSRKFARHRQHGS